MLEIDGSTGEGGGQVLRTALGLSVYTKTPVRIFNIRKSRSQPGLKSQHLSGLLALKELCGADVSGDKLGSTDVVFRPGNEIKTNLDVEIPTAGSVGLVFQVLNIAAASGDSPVAIRVRGGATFGMWAPPVVYMQKVFLPAVRQMGYRANIEVLRNGFYPKGGADVRIEIKPLKRLQPINLINRGSVEDFGGLAVASRHLEGKRVAERMADVAKTIVSRRNKELENRPVKIDIETQYVDADCPGCGFLLWFNTSRGMRIAFDTIGEAHLPSEEIGKRTAVGLLDYMETKATVDEFMTDQILPFMALAPPSKVIAPMLTEHAKTNMWVIEQFLPVRFSVKEEPGNTFISCEKTDGQSGEAQQIR